MTEKASIELTGESLSLKWWRGAGGEWRVVNWCDTADERPGSEGGEKRAFDEVFKEEVDGR